MQQSLTTPLCVDLDGTLVHTNTLFEAALVVVKKKPWVIVEIVRAGLRDKAAVKHIIGTHTPLQSLVLPYNQKLLAWLKEQHAHGRTLILATASDKKIAEKIAKELGIFQEVIASTPEMPVSAANKHSVLCKRFGKKNFSYAGNSRADIAVWKCAASAVLVHTNPDVTKHARNIIPIEAEFLRADDARVKTIGRTIRIHQWAKNLLLFTAPIAAHKISDPQILIDVIIGFFSFSCITSSIYIFNDLFDLPYDRMHARKKFRPIASGRLQILRASMLAVGMAAFGGAFAALLLPSVFLGTLLLYIIIASAYSLRFKKIPYVDIIILAVLYVLRIIAGGQAAGIPTSWWLFVFAGFFFISLGIVKRVTELIQLANITDTAIGRGYTKRDKELLTALGLTSGLFSCIVLALYAVSPSTTTLYSHPTTLVWIVPILSIWLVRMWKRALAGALPEDPVLFAIKDRFSYIVLAALSGVLAVSL